MFAGSLQSVCVGSLVLPQAAKPQNPSAASEIEFGDGGSPGPGGGAWKACLHHTVTAEDKSRKQGISLILLYIVYTHPSLCVCNKLKWEWCLSRASAAISEVTTSAVFQWIAIRQLCRHRNASDLDWKSPEQQHEFTECSKIWQWGEREMKKTSVEIEKKILGSAEKRKDSFSWFISVISEIQLWYDDPMRLQRCNLPLAFLFTWLLLGALF